MIVPEGYESQAEGVLLNGEPSYFYMDKAVEDTIGEVQGVAAVTSQFYLTSLSESCCDFAIQIIGFDPQTDFIVQNWAEKNKTGTNQTLFYAGSNICFMEEIKKIYFTKM
jgi:putative ABC transport system permease protein